MFFTEIVEVLHYIKEPFYMSVYETFSVLYFLTFGCDTEGSPNLSANRVHTVPYRFPRGTVLVDLTAHRTFLTVFHDFYLKARTLPRIKCSRFAV
jgi:hypothetical protein